RTAATQARRLNAAQGMCTVHMPCRLPQLVSRRFPMALMFPRVARNFIKNGYFPTDEGALERALTALAPSAGSMCILDPCAGEGVAIAEVAHALGREQVCAYAVEYDAERAAHAHALVD